MKEATKKQLERRGWAVGSVVEFLGLTKQDEAIVELRVALAKELRRRRQHRGLSQSQVAQLLRSSQPRVAMMETGSPSVSVDLLIRALLAMGTTLRGLARVIASAEHREAA